MTKFGLERMEEALHRRIVPTITLATHALPDAIAVDDFPVASGGIRGPLVGVQQLAVGPDARSPCATHLSPAGCPEFGSSPSPPRLLSTRPEPPPRRASLPGWGCR